jgi:hypothetical protein
MSECSGRITVGELVAAFLERCSAGTAFGVISIHNMPIASTPAAPPGATYSRPVVAQALVS